MNDLVIQWFCIGFSSGMFVLSVFVVIAVNRERRKDERYLRMLKEQQEHWDSQVKGFFR